jgi:protoporphyrinogen/coproporphyrinogen III oxidase
MQFADSFAVFFSDLCTSAKSAVYLFLPMKRVVIIGGGISGLAAAHRLTELAANGRPVDITLLEANDRLGGIIQTEQRDGFLLERGPDSFISEKPEALDLARRLGIDNRLIQTNKAYRRSFIVRKGRLRTVPEGFQLLAPSRLGPFVTTDIFSFAGKLRMAADLVIPRATTNGSTDESLANFVRRRLGQEALDRMAQPMVGGIYTADPEKLSLRATLPRFLDMERDHRSIILAMRRRGREGVGPPERKSGVSGARYSLFLSLDRGMQVLTDELQRRLIGSQDGYARTKVRLKTRVQSLERVGATEGACTWRLRTTHGESLSVDALCLAIPSYAAASLLQGVQSTLSRKLGEIRYASTATINLAYRRADVGHRLDGFGFVVPFIENRSMIACTFSSVKFAARSPEGFVLLRTFVGGALQPEMFLLADEEMVARVKKDLHELLGITGEPLFAAVTKWDNSMPQYEVGHLERVAAIEADLDDLDGLTLAGNSYRGAGIPDCIRSGEAAAEKLFAL